MARRVNGKSGWFNEGQWSPKTMRQRVLFANNEFDHFFRRQIRVKVMGKETHPARLPRPVRITWSNPP
jgi:hypothetical protein